MRALFCAVFVAAAYLIVLHATTPGAPGAAGEGVALDPLIHHYVVEHFEADTRSHNAVAAILLNYRMYDTLFEALILLTAIIGMTQFLPRAADVEAGRQAHRRATGDAATDDDPEGPGHA